jgi:cell wall-associated NlpC family hydrolase
MTRVSRYLLTALTGLALAFTLVSPAHAAPQAPRLQLAAATTSTPVRKTTPPRRWAAMAWALRQAGKPYVWGGSGPWGFDCSGLVMAAYRHAGIYLPHNTYAMLQSGRLTRISARQAHWGDLVFMYGGGHVELFVRAGITFGAHHSGTTVSARSIWSGASPVYYHVNGAK